MSTALIPKEIPLGPFPTREWNPILGCTMVDHTCRNCYAAARARLVDPNHQTIRCDGPRTFWTGKVLHAPKHWDLPLKETEPGVVFAFSQADLFHPGVRDELRDRAFDVMARARHLEFNLLTKRVERMRDYVTAWCEGRSTRVRSEVGRECGSFADHSRIMCGSAAGQANSLPMDPLPNLRIGLSAGTQEYLDARWPFLRDTPAVRRHLSIQPMLEAVRLPDDATPENLDWVVVMREIGPGARTMKVEWVRDLRDQCEKRGIPFFWETTEFDDAEMLEERRQAKEAGRSYATQSTETS